ncbi:MAG TPA: serine/threonine-protein kinase [Ktedonobacteraceae bacterium]
MEMKPVTQLGKYHLLRHLASGGMSDIYLVRDESNEQRYALKLVKQECADYYQHFRREASLLKSLQHEHILPLVDDHEGEDGIAYYVMPYIEQGSLRERLIKGPFSPEEAAPILSQVGEALQFLHELGLLHRDIKPANVLLDHMNHVWLADFGLAKDVSRSGDLTESNCLFGTPHYLAPELLQDSASKSSDIYALGVMLYEMLTGTPPFTGPTSVAICWKHIDESPPLPSALNPSLSEAVERVILRALAKRPEERFSSAREMVEAYQAALLAPTVMPHPKAPVPLALEKTAMRVPLRGRHLHGLAPQKHRRSLALAMALLLLLFPLSLGTLAVVFQSQPPPPASAGAQMISLPAYPSTTRPPPLRSPTQPEPTPTSQADNQGNDSQKHNKHKHNGEDG